MFENHLEYIRRIKKTDYDFSKLNFTPNDAFRAACDIIEDDALLYEKLIKSKIRKTWGAGIFIGIGIATFIFFFMIMYKF